MNLQVTLTLKGLMFSGFWAFEDPIKIRLLGFLGILMQRARTEP